MKTYTIRVVAEEWVDIEAADEEEAIEQARDQVFFSTLDYSCEVMHISED